MSIPLGSGSLISTPSDINHFLFSVFNGAILSQESLKLMTIFKDDVGIGIIPLEIENHSGWAFVGGIDGFVCIYLYLPELESCVTCCFNAVNDDSDEVLIRILRLYFEQK